MLFSSLRVQIRVIRVILWLIPVLIRFNRANLRLTPQV